MVDWSQVLSAMFSSMPWWSIFIIPLAILTGYLKFSAKRDIRNKRYINKKEAYREYKEEKKEYKPKNFINTDMYKDMSIRKKGEKYESHVSKHFENLGYKTVEHGKMHGVKDQGIDLMLKKDKEFVFVQCKDWNIENKHRIDSKEIQYTRMNVRDYVEKKQALFDIYDWKIFYITSEQILDKSAEHKIKEFSHEIEHQIIAV